MKTKTDLANEFLGIKDSTTNFAQATIRTLLIEFLNWLEVKGYDKDSFQVNVVSLGPDSD